MLLDIARVIGIYDRLSRYDADEGVVIAYGSMYGNTEQMAEAIVDCNQNVMTLDKIEGSIKPKTATVDFELSTYITSI